MTHGAYGARLGRSYRLDDPPTLTARTMRGRVLAVTELRCDDAGYGMSEAIADDDAYLVVLHLRDVARHERWSAGLSIHVDPVRAGTSLLLDLSCAPVAWFGDPFHTLHFYVPRAALRDLDDRTGDLVWPSHAVDDPAIRGIGQALLPHFATAARRDRDGNQLFVDHLLLGLVAHLAARYGGLQDASTGPRGGLAPWQQRRAKDLLEEHVVDGITMSRVAEACCLSSSAFVRAFKKSTGHPPHQWLLLRRVERAIQLMRNGSLALSDVALSSGFSDQSHFTRVFARRMGVSPGAWRRADAARASLTRAA